jgi:hypothetical protein
VRWFKAENSASGGVNLPWSRTGRATTLEASFRKEQFMRSTGSSAHFMGILAVLAVLSSVAALATPEPVDAEPSTFEANAVLAP